MVLELEGLSGALEVDLDEKAALIVLVEEAATPDEVKHHEVVGGGQLVQVGLHRRGLRCPAILFPITATVPLCLPREGGLTHAHLLGAA